MSEKYTPAPRGPQHVEVPEFQTVAQARRPHMAAGTDGKRQRVPKLLFQYFLDETGNLIRLVLQSTRNTKGALEAGGDPQRTIDANRSRAIREGKIPWEHDYAVRFSPWLVGTMNREQWETWREEELRRRRAVHNAKTIAHDEQWKLTEEKKANAFADAMKVAMDRKFGADAPASIQPEKPHPFKPAK